MVFPGKKRYVPGLTVGDRRYSGAHPSLLKAKTAFRLHNKSKMKVVVGCETTTTAVGEQKLVVGPAMQYRSTSRGFAACLRARRVIRDGLN